jgi:hypothetical protein
VGEKKMNMYELSKELNSISKNAGSINFSVGYTATEGNIRIHEDFQRFAFEKANNEYLMAIGKLLEYKDLFVYLFDLHHRIGVVEAQVESLMNKEETVKEPEPVKVEEKNKTF